MFSWVFFVSTCILAGYIWHLKRHYEKQLSLANDGARIGRSAFENTALGMAIVGPDLHYLDMNKAYGEIVGYSREELFQMTHKDFIWPEDAELDTPLLKELNAGKIDFFRSIKRYIHKDAYIVWAEATVSLVRDEKGNPKFYVTQIQDITKAKKAEDKLKKSKDQAEVLARTDCLTGTLNRRAFILRIKEELERTKRNEGQTSLILVDIDSFKRINDEFGHLAGDYVLQQFSECLKQNVRAYDFIGRYGGEEFIICLPDTDAEKAFSVAERMRTSIAELELHYQGSKIRITGSFGIANYNSNSIDGMDQLIAKADQAMYQAKNHKNTVYQWVS